MKSSKEGEKCASLLRWQTCVFLLLFPSLLPGKFCPFGGIWSSSWDFESASAYLQVHTEVCVCADLCPTEIFKQHFFCVTPVHTKGVFYLMYWPGLILGEAHKARNNHLVPNLVTSGVGRRRWQSSLLPTFVNRTCRSWPCWVTAWPPPHPVPELTSLWLLPSPWQQDRCFDSTPCETTPLVSVQLWWRLCVVHICLQNYHRTEKGRESALEKGSHDPTWSGPQSHSIVLVPKSKPYTNQIMYEMTLFFHYFWNEHIIYSCRLQDYVCTFLASGVNMVITWEWDWIWVWCIVN